MYHILIIVALFGACSMPIESAIETTSPSVAPVIGTVGPQVTATPVRATAAPSNHPRPPSDARQARVVHVTDGDTIVLSGIDVGEVHRETGGRKSRLIGIDTPEVYGGTECFGRDASNFTKRELEGRQVLVDFDVDTVDRYGRALVYVWHADGRFFNAQIVEAGFASQATFPPNVRYVDLFTDLARRARLANIGLWDACL